MVSYLGLNCKNLNNRSNVARSIKRLNISVEHFDSVKRLKDSKIRWNKNDLELLVEKFDTYKEILEELDILPVTTNYEKLKNYLRNFNINYDKLKKHKKYSINIIDWTNKEFILSIVNDSKSQKEVLEKLYNRNTGGNANTLKKYIKLYNIDVTHFSKNYENIKNLNIDKKIPLEYILVENSTYGRSHLKKRLYELGIKKHFCEKCGQGEEWNGEHMSLILDHVNGVHDDNRLFNLRILCPNCNSTLDTHCGKNNSKRSKKSIENNYKIRENIDFRKNLTIENINAHSKRRKVERPQYQELLVDVNLLGLEGVGRKYGVTGTAVKKWVKNYEKYNI